MIRFIRKLFGLNTPIKLSAVFLLAINASAMSRVNVVHTPSPAPSATPGVPLSPGTISIVCTNCTSDQAKVIPLVVAKYQSIRDSACFLNYFVNEKRHDENKGMNGAQIVNNLRVTPSKTTLSFYSVPWYLAATHDECGGDNADGSITWKDTCFSAYSTCQKAAFIGHELDHGMGWTHYTAGNQEAGNEYTTPYSGDEAMTACCK